MVCVAQHLNNDTGFWKHLFFYFKKHDRRFNKSIQLKQPLTNMIKPSSLLTLSICLSMLCRAQIKNFTPEGKQITRFDDSGDAVDAHDGEITYFNGKYYLYGTSYDCGFEWNNKTAPFCGFKSYSSTDMVNWKDEGFLFDAQNPLWQSRCDGKTYGCFRPHVIYNQKSKRYILWVNVYDNVSGYRVFTATKPTGPFKEADQPKISVNNNMPAAGLNNGDHDLFIDDDGTGYLAITDWRRKGAIVIEQLTDDYLNGTGIVSELVTPAATEAPALFKRNGIYYITYSDPNCGYCSGTGTSYRTAKSIMGPWSVGRRISDNSCGGQPSFVSTLKINSETIYLYGSDLWNNAAKNEAMANFYWAPLTFAADGAINLLECFKSFSIRKNAAGSNRPTFETNDFSASCGIGGKVQRSQTFTAKVSGKLKQFGITTLKSGYPSKDLEIVFYDSYKGRTDTGKILASITIPRDAIGWSAKNITISPNINLTAGKRYTVVLKSETDKGCFGFAYNDSALNCDETTSVSNDNGENFTIEVNRRLKYQLLIE